jgi:hypothetical protein
MKRKTFADVGIIFTAGSGCITCRDNSCQNTVTLKDSDVEYHVHISTYLDRSEFRIHASSNSNTETADDICIDFDNEHDAVQFVCDTFNWFKCF